MNTTTQQITAEQLLMMPDNHMRRELVAGEVREMTPAGHEHGGVAVDITLPLGFFVKEHGLGRVYAAETGFILARNPDTVRAPDVAFVNRDRLALAPKGTGFFPGAPDLAVEVMSPDDTHPEVESKVQDWLGAGTRMVVVVNPRNRTLRVHRLGSKIVHLTVDDTFDGDDVVPGFRLPVREIFGE